MTFGNPFRICIFESYMHPSKIFNTVQQCVLCAVKHVKERMYICKKKEEK